MTPSVRVHTFTPDQKRVAALREAHMRQRVYPGLVAKGRMTAEEAERGIAVMQAIADDYAGPDLFGARRG